MIIHRNHRLLIAIVAIVILVMGIFLGTYLATNLGDGDFKAIQMGLSFTILVMLFIIVSLNLESHAIMQSKKKVKMKKGQAALEFLTTYAWAFLVILIMIGALAYFGILRPSRLLPDRCNFGPEVECQDFQIAFGVTGVGDGIIKIKLKNNVGEAINVEAIAITTEASAALGCGPATSVPPIDDVWPSGEIRDFTFPTCDSTAVGFVAEDKGKVSIKLTYYSVRSGSEYTHDVNGEIFATII